MTDAIETVDITGLTHDEQLAIVHELTVRRLVEALRDPEKGLTYGVLQCARGFLNDNKVTGLDIPGSAQEELKTALAARAPFQPKLTGTE